jgi:hypothetical protein
MTKRTLARALACAAVLCTLPGVFAFDRATEGTAATVSSEAKGVEAAHARASALRLWRSRRAGVAAAGQAGAQGSKPVEQVRKNIQVIKGLPSSQLFPLMNFVSSSLGVTCNYCHVKNGTGGDDWVWESDEKHEKQTARRMMQMVLSVNNTNRADFRDNAVTCYTCHRGETRPAGMPTLPLTVSGHEPNTAANAAAAKSSEALPAVEQILTRYVEAVGGKEAAAKLQSRVLKGTREASQGRIWPVEITMKGPDKFLIVANTPQGVVQQALNGSSGWLKSSRGTQALLPAELEQVRNGARVYDVIKVGAASPGMKVAGRERIGERDVLVIESKPSGGVTEKLYFDAQTGLLLRRLTLTETVLLPIPSQIDFEDYREVDGLKIPFTVRVSEIDTYFSSTRRFTEIKHNVPVDDTKFQMPAATPVAPGAGGRP